MYPRNAASPEPISIGAVVQISDGAVQTSGVTVRIKPVGVAEGDGAGTTSYSTDGVVIYTPTQAETDYTSFLVIAKKTGCIPVAVTVVTSAEAIAGTVKVGTLPSIPANWITAAGIAADAITAAKVAADVIAAIQNGLATAAELAKVPKSDGTVAFNATAVSGIQSGLATTSALATAQADLDILTGTDGVTLATSQPNYTPATSAQATSIEADTQDLQTQIGTAGAGLTALGDTRLGNLDASVSTRLASASYTAPLDAAGTRTAVGLASANLDTQLGNIVADTNELQTDWADGGRLDVILDARASQTSVDDVPTNAELAAAIITGLTTALTEGYRGTGATGSVRDLLYELLANITEFTITSTTKTAKKLDGSTTAKTYTLNDATTPTGITETT